MKAKFKWLRSEFYPDGGYWSPQNYEAETIHLIKVYGHTNHGRRFKPTSENQVTSQQPPQSEGEQP